MGYGLEQVDEVRERTGVPYKMAKEALDAVDGDVLEAVIYIESKQKGNFTDSFTDNFTEMGNELVEKLKELVRKGNVTRILLRRNGETMINIPVTAGAVGAVIFTPATIAGILVALATGCKLEIVKDDGEIIDIRDVTEDTFVNVRQRVNEARTKYMNNNEGEEKQDE